MNKFLKNNLKVFVAVVISGIIFGGIGVYAASQYFAKDISFTPSDEKFKKENGEPIDNVEDALNELYKINGSDSNKYNCISGTFDASVCMTNDKCLIEDKIKPSLFVIRNYNTGQIHVYNEMTSSTKYVSYAGNNSVSEGTLSTYYEISDSGFYSKLKGGWAIGTNGYVVCEQK